MNKKTILITGSAKRIGKEIALKMAENGYNIALHYNNSEQDAKETANLISKIGVSVAIVKANLGNDEEINNLFKKIQDKFGHIDCLVNNASVFEFDTIDNFTATTWNNNLSVNLYAPVRLIQLFVKQLPANCSGNIINMLDYAVWRYPEKFLSYTASKAALLAVTKQLAYSLASSNIRLNAIGPGRVLKNQYESDEGFQKSLATSPLKIDAKLDEITNTILYILNTPSMTGQMIALDGGRHLVGPEGY